MVYDLGPMSRRTIWLVAMMCASGACEANKVSGPAPEVVTPPQLQWSAVPGTSSGSAPCQPTINVAMAGPVGARLTWTGMGLHTVEYAYDDNFDQAFVQRFWAADGLAAGESLSSNAMGFGAGFVHITYRFRYTLSTDPGTTHVDSIATTCQ
jgi:hypothetical protein